VGVSEVEVDEGEDADAGADVNAFAIQIEDRGLCIPIISNFVSTFPYELIRRCIVLVGW
jgi:hypothetical protein